jgi:vacuolar protein sorting-associated protein 13A/C
MSGFINGIGLGVSGLVVKPMTGIMDATSKTAEGLKNTATHFEDKPYDVVI